MRPNFENAKPLHSTKRDTSGSHTGPAPPMSPAPSSPSPGPARHELVNAALPRPPWGLPKPRPFERSPAPPPRGPPEAPPPDPSNAALPAPKPRPAAPPPGSGTQRCPAPPAGPAPKPRLASPPPGPADHGLVNAALPRPSRGPRPETPPPAPRSCATGLGTQLCPAPPAGPAPSPGPAQPWVGERSTAPPSPPFPRLCGRGKMAELDIGQHCQVQHCRQRGDAGNPIPARGRAGPGSDDRGGGGG